MSTTDHQDAARYRWLRQAWLEGLGTDEEPEQLNTTIGAVYTEAEMDAAIDAVLAAHPAPAEGDAIRSADARDFFERWALTANPDERTNWQVWSAAWTCAVSWASRSAPQPKGSATVEQWEAALSAVMPADFKDWWQNSRREWPAVAAGVIESQQADRDLGWEMAAKAAQAPAPAPAEPYLHVYEYDTAFGVHREFYPTQWNGSRPTRTVALYTVAPAPAVAPTETGGTNGRRDGLRPALHGGVAMGGHTPGALADLLFASHDVMSLNAELDLPMDQLVRLAQAVLIAAPDAGLSPAQEPKYTVNGHAIVNRATGVAIPADEPVFILRASDRRAASIIGEYAEMCNDPVHAQIVSDRFCEFGEWAEAHPERMKEPDTAPASHPPVQGTEGA